ncbi:50S ribosomal protein L13 [SAR86 cluster bacterium]|jgi:large subunit ribosomal protein L13|nr:50S ribosomal protein L13 [SAR86 cluster bacterium]RZO97273.1 MAG: 50S ribosomal protein L13 [Gammaproteobacteria bacterium]|tara:strand:+ start:16 stop:444 length:429 start_codon:yes stop_codon:yes gene_type:complete
MKTKSYKNTDLEKKWLLLDASDKTLGRLSTKVAFILMGKDKAQYTPNSDLGDYVVIINAEKIKITGNKDTQKNYYRHTGYPGGLKSTTFLDMIEKKPEEIIFKAVQGMLPKNKLSKTMISKLKVYEGENHPHVGQNPIKIEL